MTSHFNFKITPEDIDRLSKLLAWHEMVKEEMINTLAVHGNVYTKIGYGGLGITGVWVDEFAVEDPFKIEEKFINKLKALDAPKKPRKPKHKLPFWANDWRKK